MKGCLELNPNAQYISDTVCWPAAIVEMEMKQVVGPAKTKVVFAATAF